MKLPEIPTDNLYKFMALSGLTIVILSFLPHLHIYYLKMNLIRLKGEAESLGTEVEWVSSDLKELYNDIESLKVRITKLTGIHVSEINTAFDNGRSLSDILKIEDVEVEKYSKELDELRDKKADYFEMNRKQLIRTIQIKTKLNEQEHILSMVVRELRLTIVASVLGILLAFVGFELWYKKLQIPQDTIINKKAKNLSKE